MVINQTERRVLLQESVPAGEKIVSIFEEHPDIIIKDRRDRRGRTRSSTGRRAGRRR
jgi:IS5 family transposase